METGCQNIQLCTTILKVAFSPQSIGPLFLFPLLYITFQCAEALLLALCFKCYQRVTAPHGGKFWNKMSYVSKAERTGSNDQYGNRLQFIITWSKSKHMFFFFLFRSKQMGECWCHKRRGETMIYKETNALLEKLRKKLCHYSNLWHWLKVCQSLGSQKYLLSQPAVPQMSNFF